MTFTKSNPHFARALEDDEAFLSLLKRHPLTTTDWHGEEQPMSEDTVHFDQEKLLDYAAGLLGDEETEKIMQHIAECRPCAFRVLEMTMEGEEMQQELLEWADAPPLFRS